MTPEQIAAELESALCAPDWAASLTHVHNAVAALASQPVPAPDLVERVAMVLYATDWPEPRHASWTETADDMRLRYRTLARAIIPIIQADERESCAKVAESVVSDWKVGSQPGPLHAYRHASREIATAIRERNGG